MTYDWIPFGTHLFNWISVGWWDKAMSTEWELAPLAYARHSRMLSRTLKPNLEATIAKGASLQGWRMLCLHVPWMCGVLNPSELKKMNEENWWEGSRHQLVCPKLCTQLLRKLRHRTKLWILRRLEDNVPCTTSLIVSSCGFHDCGGSLVELYTFRKLGLEE